MRLAIIDLGTNTFTLILVEIKQAEYSVIYKNKVAVKLGEDGISEGIIGKDAYQRGLDAIEQHKKDTLLDSYIFSGDDRMISDVWSAGRHLVKNGEHISRPEITKAYRKATKKLTEF